MFIYTRKVVADMKPFIEKPIFERVAISLNETLQGAPDDNRIALLGIKPSGEVIETFEDKGEIQPRAVDPQRLSFWWERLQSKKDAYHHFRTLNENIDIYAPLSLSGSESLLEWVVFSGVVDPHTDLNELSPNKSFGLLHADSLHTDLLVKGFLNLRNALNGRNYFNWHNLVIDFKYGIMITRRGAQHSSSYSNELIYNPLSEIMKTHSLYLAAKEHHNLAREKEHFDLISAKTLALRYLKESFFVSY